MRLVSRLSCVALLLFCVSGCQMPDAVQVKLCERAVAAARSLADELQHTVDKGERRADYERYASLLETGLDLGCAFTPEIVDLIEKNRSED